MFEEAKREAIGLQHFASNTRRKIFICSDRREHTTLQNKVEKLEKRKINNIKKYEDEMKDWKEILRQLQHEKEGMVLYKKSTKLVTKKLFIKIKYLEFLFRETWMLLFLPGAVRFQCLIEGDKETFKSSLSTRKQNEIKSIRRSLAPQTTQDGSYKPTLQHQLISKPPSVPRKRKVELLKREEVRLSEVRKNEGNPVMYCCTMQS
jgi:hypothetical protein